MTEYQLAADGAIWVPPDGPLIAPNANDPAYQAYLVWHNAGNVADPVPVPPATVPAQVTRWQAYQQMLVTASAIHPAPATLFTDIQTIAATTGGRLLLAWQNQEFVYRHGPFVTQLKPQLGLTDDGLDALFTAAALLPR
jgi:hypothetical protein